MKIGQCIREFDGLTHNAVSLQQKVIWLGRLDLSIHRELLGQYRETLDTPFTPYDEDTDQDTALLVPPPYDELYRWYLEMMVADVNRESEAYNHALAKYEEALNRYAAWLNREHSPAERYRHRLW